MADPSRPTLTVSHVAEGPSPPTAANATWPNVLLTRVPDVAAQLTWEPVALRAGQTLWFHSRTPHRSGPNRSARPRRALYPTYNAAREGDRRAEYYAAKRAAFAHAPRSDRARVSLIGDFEGRPVS